MISNCYHYHVAESLLEFYKLILFYLKKIFFIIVGEERLFNLSYFLIHFSLLNFKSLKE